MLKSFKCIVCFSFLVVCKLVLAQNSEVNLSVDRLKIYVEGDNIDADYLRESIEFVDFVNDPKSSDVHVIVIKETTGSGGSKYSVWFNSISFKNINGFTLNVYTLPDETNYQIRSLINNSIIKGLMPFLNECEESNNYSVSLKRNSKTEQIEKEDKWNSWVYKLSTSGGFNVEESLRSYNYNGTFTADRITDKFKIENYLYLRKSVTNYLESGNQYLYNYKYGSSKAVYSLSSHWSTGFTVYAYQSSYHNTSMCISALQAFEYNFFPWSESNKRMLTLMYTFGYEDLSLYEINLRDNIREKLPLHKMYLMATSVQPWGEISLDVVGSQYLNNFTFYTVSFGSEISYRIVKGLSLTFNINAKTIHDQLYIPKSSYTIEEVLLNTKKLPSKFEFNGTVGISYQFGYIYNNVVNRRL